MPLMAVRPVYRLTPWLDMSGAAAPLRASAASLMKTLTRQGLYADRLGGSCTIQPFVLSEASGAHDHHLGRSVVCGDHRGDIAISVRSSRR